MRVDTKFSKVQESVFKPFGLVSHIIMKLERTASPASKKSFAGHLWARGKWSGRWWKRTKELTTKEQQLVCSYWSKWLKLKGPNCLWVVPRLTRMKTTVHNHFSREIKSPQIPLTNHTGCSATSSLASRCLYQASLGAAPPVPGVLHPEKGGNVTLLLYQGNQQMNLTSPISSNLKESWQYLVGKEENIWN